MYWLAMRRQLSMVALNLRQTQARSTLLIVSWMRLLPLLSYICLTSLIWHSKPLTSSVVTRLSIMSWKKLPTMCSAQYPAFPSQAFPSSSSKKECSRLEQSLLEKIWLKRQAIHSVSSIRTASGLANLNWWAILRMVLCVLWKWQARTASIHWGRRESIWAVSLLSALAAMLWITMRACLMVAGAKTGSYCSTAGSSSLTNERVFGSNSSEWMVTQLMTCQTYRHVLSAQKKASPLKKIIFSPSPPSLPSSISFTLRAISLMYCSNLLAASARN